MINIYKEELPKELERPCIEEYYNLYQSREGFPLLNAKDLRWTADLTRLRKRDLKNPLLMQAIEAYTSIEADNVEFIGYGPDDIITALARVLISEDNYHIIDIIFLNYPCLSEKYSYIKNLLDIAICQGYARGCKTISCEVGKNDSIMYEIVSKMGYSLTPELEKEASNFPTFIMERTIVEKNEQTRSRQQK